MSSRCPAEPYRGLSHYGSLAAEECRRQLRTSGDASYLTPLLDDYPSRGGKGLRPSICLGTCEAFGGTAAAALPSAASIELLHNAFLVHDDIEDASLLRRGRPTLHRCWGTPLALNAGDGLALVAMSTLGANGELLGARLSSLVMREFEFMSRQTVSGQALELGWRMDNRLDLDADDYLDLIMRKTCWYTTVLPLRVGALIGSWGTADLDPLVAFGFHLGAAFQIRDDILNLTGDVSRYGKEPLGDLLEGKRTLMLLHLAAAADSSDRSWLECYLDGERQDRRLEEATELYELMRRYGSIAFAESFASGMAEAARISMEHAFAGLPDTPAREFVGSLIPYMIERDA